MVAKKLSQQAVFSAANRLNEQGIAPTAKKLLAEIGMGSLTTHTKYLKQWQQLRDNDDNLPQTLSSSVTALSSETLSSFESAINHCWLQGYQDGQAAMASQLRSLTATLTEKTAALENARQALLEHDPNFQCKTKTTVNLNKVPMSRLLKL